MGICNSTKNPDTNKKALIKQVSSNGSIFSLQTQLPFNYLSEQSIKEDINHFYKIGECLGRGSYGIVREAIENKTNNKYSVKTVYRDQFEDNKLHFLKQEIQISLLVNHENIIKCYEVYEDPHYIHFVFEFIEGTDLFDYIIQSQSTCINEYQSAIIFSQILDAVHYLHLNSIVHRDIKLENFLIYNQDSNLKVKLIDFGFASKTTIGFLREKIGSLNYLAPEIFTDLTYNNKVDIWAAGITLFNMLTGKQPFSNNSDSQLISDIVNKEMNFEDKSCSQLSSECKEILILLLTKNHNQRIDAFQARNHMWFRKIGINDNAPTFRIDFNPHPEKIQEILDNLCKQCSIKNQITTTLLNIPNIIIESVCEILCNKSIDSTMNWMGKNMVIMYDILNTIISVCNNELLKEKLSSIINDNKEILEKIRVNYTEYFNTLKKRKDIIEKEKLWMLFSNASESDKKGLITLNQIEEIFIQNKKKFDQEKFNEILKLNMICKKEKYTFDEFAVIWEYEEKSMTNI